MVACRTYTLTPYPPAFELVAYAYPSDAAFLSVPVSVSEPQPSPTESAAHSLRPIGSAGDLDLGRSFSEQAMSQGVPMAAVHPYASEWSHVVACCENDCVYMIITTSSSFYEYSQQMFCLLCKDKEHS